MYTASVRMLVQHCLPCLLIGSSWLLLRGPLRRIRLLSILLRCTSSSGLSRLVELQPRVRLDVDMILQNWYFDATLLDH